MPVMDGREALPLILQASPATKVIVFSACADIDPEQDLLRNGAARFVRKPVELGVVAEVLGEVLAR